MSETITVVGATGDQGGAVVTALLASKKFKLRATTRDASSSKAAALKAKGVEVVQADMFDRSSLVKAFQGSYGVFLVTDFWTGADLNPEKEWQQGKNAADAAKEAGVQHLVYSTLEDPRPHLPLSELKELPGHKGRYVAHLEVKAEIEGYIKKTGVPATMILTGCYYENFLKFFPLFKQPDGSYTWMTSATGTFPWMDVQGDFGSAVAAIFEDKDKYLGKTAACTSEYTTPQKVLDAIQDATGKKLNYVKLSYDQAFSAGYPGAEDLANMFAYFEKEGSGVMKNLRKMEPVSGTTVQQWAATNKSKLVERIKSFDG